jgi:hypothetical protein
MNGLLGRAPVLAADPLRLRGPRLGRLGAVAETHRRRKEWTGTACTHARSVGREG